MLRKLLLFSVLITISSMSLLADIDYSWKVTLSGGELHGIWPFRWIGYRDVVQDPPNKTLSCTGNGLHECVLTGVEIPNCVASHTNSMISYADNQIKDGVLSGNYTDNYYCGEQFYLSTVTWSTDDNGISNLNITNIPISIP
jgi:hypothetical protein